MKRMHVHLGVRDLDTSIAFYSELFSAAPVVRKPDYAKWLLDDPRLNFAISQGHDHSGIAHLGLQAEDTDELREIYGRLQRAEQPVLEEGQTTCCYSRSEKSWTADPDGVKWEVFHTHGEATTYGNPAPLVPASAATGACCG